MKNEIKLNLLTDNFMLGLILSLQASNGESISEIVEIATQSAINDNPNNHNVEQLTEYAGNYIRTQLGISF